MNLSIKNGGYSFLIRLDLMFSRSLSKRITRLVFFIFLNMYTSPQHALTRIILFPLK